ncbi:MAG: tripartite tricarboxylate transporter TctB family protein [Hyphomicrobiales bacterium]
MQPATKDLLLGAVLFALGLGALLYIQYGPGEALQTSRDAQITFRSFPTVISVLLMLLAGLFTATTLFTQFGAHAPEVPARSAPEPGAGGRKQPTHLALRMLALLVLLIAYAELLSVLPYWLLTGLFLFLLFFVFGETNPLRNALVAALGAAAFHGLFVMILQLPLY